jgi:hypothetical protein
VKIGGLRRVFLPILALIPLLAGCSTPSNQAVSAAPPPVSGALVGGALGETIELHPARIYLRPAAIPPKVAAYGIFALHGRPTSATRPRLMMACMAFVSYLVRAADLPSSVGPDQQMLTIWPLDNPDAQEAKADKCDYLLNNYAVAAADSAIADADRQGVYFNGQGPFLIGWSPSDTRGVPDKLALVVDMSAYTSQDSFDHAFMFWKRKIVENPELWRQGFSLEKWRLAIRDFADTYGNEILSAAHLSDASGKKD